MLNDIVSRLLAIAGHEEEALRLNYADYCVVLCERGHEVKPISMAQWDSLCSIKGNRNLTYASTTEQVVRNLALPPVRKG